MFSIVFASIALLISVFTLYLQFFHHPRRIRVVSLGIHTPHGQRFAICNGGKQAAYLVSISANYMFPLNQGTLFSPVEKIQTVSTSFIQPDGFLEFFYQDTQENFRKATDTYSSLARSGKVQNKRVSIMIDVSISFSDGVIFYHQFESAVVSFNDQHALQAMSYNEVGLDFLKSAKEKGFSK